MILVVDNHDSFTFNLVHSLQRAAARSPRARIAVVRNDGATAAELLAARPAAVVLSPGPGRPEDAGVCLELLARADRGLPILGVCLGHQALVLAEGGELELDPEPSHGVASRIEHDGSPLFRELPPTFEVARYHSIRATAGALPPSLRCTARTDGGIVMAVEHATDPRFGVQFHPESILTPDGDRLVANFVELAFAAPANRPVSEPS